MLSMINRYCHGYIAVPAITRLFHHGVFELFDLDTPITFAQLVEQSKANDGYFQVALRLMETLAWITKTDTGSYLKTAKCAESSVLTNDIFELFELDFDACFKNDDEALK
ncbi:MAG: hypothetical protein HRT35_27315, partial [Algicola sp.]|nr:hypothetical protein [Algicola sp.]